MKSVIYKWFTDDIRGVTHASSFVRTVSETGHYDTKFHPQSLTWSLYFSLNLSEDVSDVILS